MTRQRAWQLRQKAQGNCMECGKPAKWFNLCEDHRAKRRPKNREYQRQRFGWKQKVSGMVGRPLITQDVNLQMKMDYAKLMLQAQIKKVDLPQGLLPSS